jgi:dihydroorotate dehydrogenase electron transfer subunit
MVRVGSGQDPLLRRPFSIHRVVDDGLLQLYFRVVGRGTEMLAGARAGDSVSILGPLGRGYRLHGDSPTVIVGGGLGIAPLLFLADERSRQKGDRAGDLIILGGRNRKELEPLLADFRTFDSALHVATDDGSLGHHGFVTELLASLDLPAGSRVYGCGPEAMLARLATICEASSTPCQVSVESVMACGMGACLGCSRVSVKGEYTHVCLNGPVYDAGELVWNI